MTTNNTNLTNNSFTDALLAIPKCLWNQVLNALMLYLTIALSNIVFVNTRICKMLAFS